MGIKKFFAGTAAVPVITVVAILVIYFLFLPPILKYIVENQGEKQLGRKVEVGYIGFNIFKGSFNMHDLKIYEPDKKAIFLSFRRFYINFNVPEIFRKTYHIESVGLDEPVIHISQTDSTFNFTDILDRLSSDSTETIEEEPTDTTASEPVKYIVEDFTVTSGLLSYVNPDFELNDTIKNLNIEVPKVAWDDPELYVSFLFNLAGGGDFKGNISFNTSDQSMILRDSISNFNLFNYKHYLNPYLVTGSLNGFLNTNNILIGNTKTFDLIMSGNLSLDDFSITDTSGAIVAGFREFSVTFDSINFSADILSFDTISLVEPVLHYIMTPTGDNFTAMMPSTGTTDSTTTEQVAETAYSGENPLEMMVAYIQESMNTYLFQSYNINRIQILNGKIVYEDYTPDEPFRAGIDSLTLKLSNLTTRVDRSYGSLYSRLNEEGHFVADISVDPHNLLNMDLKYEISSLMVPDFNPYSVYYIAYPFPRGAFNYEGSLVINEKKLNSSNKIVIEKIYIGDKVKNKTAVSLPVKLAIAILRDRQGDIRLDVPVSGDLNDPKVKIWRIVLDILKNIIIKAATAPYDMLASAFGGNEKDYKDILFKYRQGVTDEKQQTQLARIAEILTDKPELNVAFNQVVDPEQEKARIAIWETKKLYLYEFVRNSQVPALVSPEDSLELERIDPDKDLYNFFAARLDGTLAHLSLAEKCYQMAGPEKVNKMQEAIMSGRNRSLSDYMTRHLKVPEERFSVTVSNDPALVNAEYPFFSIKFDVKE